jgi:undecaprenyl-diphosphatase
MRKNLPIIFVAIFTMLACLIITFIDSATVLSVDTWVYSKISLTMNPPLTLTMRFITESGSKIAVIILCLSFFLFPKTRKKWAIPITSTVLVTALFNIFLKLLFSRERPDILQLIYESDYSFPSGHAMNNMAFYTMVFLLTNKYIKNKKIKIGISIMCIVLPLLIGISRIYLGVHYASDVVVGWFLGFIIAMILFKMFEKFEKFDNQMMR